MSPILVRPVREQLEHDRVIRALQAKLKRKFDVTVNMGNESAAPVRIGKTVVFPDLVLTLPRKAGSLGGVVEVETAESVNNLEAMAQWAHYARARAPFHLYVPAGSVDMVRRLCANHQITVDEIWTYFALGTQMRFTLAHRAPTVRSDHAGPRASSASAGRPAPAARAGARPASGSAAAGRPGMAKAKAARPAGRSAAGSRTAKGKAITKSAKPARSRKR